jgi:hypothetical protein
MAIVVDPVEEVVPLVAQQQQRELQVKGMLAELPVAMVTLVLVGAERVLLAERVPAVLAVPVV